jgi:type II secretion system protein N
MAGSIVSFRFFLYLVYAVVLTAVLLYVRFPAEKMRVYCEHRLDRVIGHGRTSIAKIDFHFPATIEFRKVKIGGEPVGGTNNEIVLDWLRLFPSSEGFLTSWLVDGEFYSGFFEATLDIQLKEKIFQLKDIRLEQTDLAEITASMPAIQREITGELALSGEYKAKFDQPLKGVGGGNLYLTAGTMQLIRQILTLDAIDFEEIDIPWKYADSVLKITDGKMIGQQLDADFSGTFTPPFLPPVGGLKISGLLVPGEQFLKDKPQIGRLVQRLMKQYKTPAVPFKLGGTLNKPTFRLSV